MISLNGSHVTYALQAAQSVMKDPVNWLSFLLNIASVNNTCTEFYRPSQYQAAEIDALQHRESDPANGSPGLITALGWMIHGSLFRAAAPRPGSSHITGPTASLPAEGNFRLAKEIERCYPGKQGSLDNIDRLVIFGDSLSDSKGLMFKKSHHLLPSYNQYYDGRFTNGFVWDEFLSSPAFLKKEAISFAEGGSTSARYSRFNLLSNILSNLETQIKSYQPFKRDLAILLCGANDYITLRQNNIIKVVEKQIDDISGLLLRGVDNILVMGMPDISLSPEAAASDERRKYKDITIAHNALLERNVAELKMRYPQKKIFFFNTPAAMEEILNLAKKMGYNTTQSYIHHGYVHMPASRNPRLDIAPEYIYNDSVHPTQEVHYAFATLLNDFIIQHYAKKTADS